MARRNTRSEWEARVRTLTENNPKWGSRRIATELELTGGSDAPSPRTIDRIIAEHRASTDRAGFRYVHWPESFERGDLPWEAAPTALALLRWYAGLAPPRPIPAMPLEALAEYDRRMDALEESFRNGGAQRPTVRLTRWLYRVTQAAPDEPFGERLVMASGLDVGVEHLNREVEAQIVTMPIVETEDTSDD